jgi:hypothetical protein
MMEDKIFYVIGTIAALFYIYTQLNQIMPAQKIVHVAVPQYMPRFRYGRRGHGGHRGHRRHQSP